MITTANYVNHWLQLPVQSSLDYSINEFIHQFKELLPKHFRYSSTLKVHMYVVVNKSLLFDESFSILKNSNELFDLKFLLRAKKMDWKNKIGRANIYLGSTVLFYLHVIDHYFLDPHAALFVPHLKFQIKWIGLANFEKKIVKENLYKNIQHAQQGIDQNLLELNVSEEKIPSIETLLSIDCLV